MNHTAIFYAMIAQAVFDYVYHKRGIVLSFSNAPTQPEIDTAEKLLFNKGYGRYLYEFGIDQDALQRVVSHLLVVSRERLDRFSERSTEYLVNEFSPSEAEEERRNLFLTTQSL